MFKLHLVFSVVMSTCAGMSMMAKTSKSMLVKGPSSAETMFVEHSSVSDLDSSASGYIYQSNANRPATIVHLGNPTYQEPLEFHQLLSGVPHTLINPLVRGKGAKHQSDQWKSYGEKGVKGFKSYGHYDQGGSGKYEGDHGSGFYKILQGGKNAHLDKGGNYGGHKETKTGESGGSFEEKKSHKKGHKTTGYHNVYHKDEFKKQHTFYDEADNSGSYDKHGKDVKNYASEKGAHQRKDHLDSAYHVGDYGEKGGFDRGSFSKGSKEFLGVEGGSNHFSEGSEYGNEGSKSFRKDYEFGGDLEFDREH